ncbi:SUMF1/EgtB/PvdO family nonheme iron enzyme, partial [Arsukibacterium sp.]|uniref:SUMF1/EgtB/PvdO family nonheme iron enzyme n=1 Tax=Arsukibacterium sp. TaxID=1977258 RepID=UPI002FDAE4E9
MFIITVLMLLAAVGYYYYPVNQDYSELTGTLVSIPAGNFTMGCSTGDTACYPEEKPIRTVSVSAFKMMETEATFAMWDACVAAGGCSHRPDDQSWGRGNRPVINVSFNDITQQFIPWLNKTTGQTFRLPSEAEWEYAARAGSTTRYSVGNTIECSQAHYGGYDDDCVIEKKTLPVKSFSANAFGLYDMQGNVMEWTQDCLNRSYRGAPVNAIAWQDGDCNYRILRGGSFGSDPGSLRFSFRLEGGVANQLYYSGFRLVQDSLPDTSKVAHASAEQVNLTPLETPEAKSLRLAADEAFYSSLRLDKDFVAIDLYRQAAALGSAYADAQLALMYLRGLGVTKNSAIARQFRDTAIQKFAQHPIGGHENAVLYRLAAFVELDTEAELAEYRKLAEQGDANAQYKIGMLYDQREGYRAQQDAVIWFYKAAEQGHAGAQLAVTKRYIIGRGVYLSDEGAHIWYLKAAEQDDPFAQYELGSRYLNGLVVEQSTPEAIKWLYKAA